MYHLVYNCSYGSYVEHFLAKKRCLRRIHFSVVLNASMFKDVLIVSSLPAWHYQYATGENWSESLFCPHRNYVISIKR